MCPLGARMLAIRLWRVTVLSIQMRKIGILPLALASFSARASPGEDVLQDHTRTAAHL
jgi:hypothetical protein